MIAEHEEVVQMTEAFTQISHHNQQQILMSQVSKSNIPFCQTLYWSLKFITQNVILKILDSQILGRAAD